jgi:hypothetical protein
MSACDAFMMAGCEIDMPGCQGSRPKTTQIPAS